MANYSEIIPIILKHEGGLTNDPADRGGITNYGISLRFAQSTKNKALLDVDKDGDIDADDIRKLTKEQAIKIYKMYFWDKPFKLDEEPSDKVALILFDAAVNHGNGGAVSLTQKALNSMGYKLDVDGLIGPKTLGALRSADPDKFVDAFLSVREKYYYAIVAKNSSQKVFLKGWLNRIASLKSAVKNFA